MGMYIGGRPESHGGRETDQIRSWGWGKEEEGRLALGRQSNWRQGTPEHGIKIKIAKFHHSSVINKYLLNQLAMSTSYTTIGHLFSLRVCTAVLNIPALLMSHVGVHGMPHMGSSVYSV